MSEPITIEAESLKAALEQAQQLLGAGSADEVEYRYDRDHFRSGARTIKILATKKEGAAPVSADLLDASTKARQWVEQLIAAMGVEGSVGARTRDGGVVVTIRSSDDNGLLIGKDGRNIEALQVLVDRAAERMGIETRVVLDVGDYRTRKDDQLKADAKAVAQRVARSGESERLRPMNAYERHLVHAAVQEIPGLATRSIGEGSLKEVEIRKA